MSTADERLKQFLREARDWEKKVTNIPGIFLLKLPTFKGNSPSLAIEVRHGYKSGYDNWIGFFKELASKI